MAVGYRSSSDTGNTTPVSSRTIPVPSGAAAGDIVLVFLARWEPGFNPSVTAPSGFTRHSQVLSGDSAAKIDIWWKRLTASDSGTYTFSWSGGAMWSTAHAVCLTGGLSSGDPILGVNSWSGTAGIFGTTSLTLSDAGSGVVWNCYNDASSTHTPPTGFIEVIDNDCASSAYRIPGATGAQSALGGSVSSLSPAAALLVAIASDGGGSPAPATDAFFNVF